MPQRLLRLYMIGINWEVFFANLGNVFLSGEAHIFIRRCAYISKTFATDANRKAQ